MTMDQHLDAERLAAFADGSLTRAERAAVEAHASDCARCLQLLAAMVRTEPPVARKRWGGLVVLRWAVPVAAAATAVALWINAGRTSPGDLTPPPDVVAPAPVRQDKAPAASPPPNSAPAAKSAPFDAVAAPEAKKEEERAGARLRTALPKEAAEAPAAPPPSRDEASDRAAGLVAGLRAARSFEVVSPDPATRWRVRGILLERSTDAGKTWISEAEALHGEWLAGSSPALTVAWFVGRRGDLLLTADAKVWRRLKFPEAVDLIAVRAASEREAEVTAADGRVFATVDGGGSWILRR